MHWVIIPPDLALCRVLSNPQLSPCLRLLGYAVPLSAFWKDPSLETTSCVCYRSNLTRENLLNALCKTSKSLLHNIGGSMMLSQDSIYRTISMCVTHEGLLSHWFVGAILGTCH